MMSNRARKPTEAGALPPHPWSVFSKMKESGQ